jgi:hypothetical protein
MKVFGLSLQPLNSYKLTIAAAISVLIWMFFVGMLDNLPDNLPGGTDAVTAGEALIAIAWGTLCSALGVQFRQPRELVFYGVGCALLLSLHHVVLFLYGAAPAA